MSQLILRSIAANAVDDTKLRLNNNSPLRARNFADSGDISIIKVNASDRPEFSVMPQSPFTPASANDVVNKAYADQLAQGLYWKAPVRAVSLSALAANTYANGTLGVGATLTANSNGALAAVDGVTLVANDRLLVAAEGTASHNGLYIVTQVGDGSNPYILTRSIDSDEAAELLNPAMLVSEGTVYADTGWVGTANAPITVGTTGLPFVQFSQAGVILAGAGLLKTGLTIDAVAADTSLTMNADSMQVNVNGSGAIVVSSGIKVNLEASNPSLQISANELGVKLDAAGAIVKGAGGIAVQLESSNPSLQISTDKLGVKLSGSGTITSGASGLAVGVDGTTIRISSNQLKGLTPNKEGFTLNGTDITNQYVDLAHVAIASSIDFGVKGFIPQFEGEDYSVSLTGGSGGNTRITFINDLATGGNAALVSGDKVFVKYQY